jgi:imidazolonepropionase-like amidohydrolase
VTGIRLSLPAAALTCALAALWAAAPAAQRPAPLAFEGARILVGDGRVIDDGVIIVTDGRITSVGPARSIQRPRGATRVDLTGKIVMPTLVDAHIHIGYENGQSWRAENYTRANVLDTLDRLAYYGVGAVFSAGTDPADLAIAVQRDQAAGRAGGARFVFAGGFGPPGAGPNQQLLNELAKFPDVVVRGITGDADARQELKALAAKQISFVKVWVTDRNGTQRKTTPEAYRALIDEAHKHNIRVVAHATDNLGDAKDLARAGLDGSMHAIIDADPEFAALMKKNDGFVIPSQGLGLRGNVPGLAPWFEDPLFQETMPAATIARYREQAARAAPPAADALTLDQRLQRTGRMLKVLLDGGVRVALGGDSGAMPDYPPGFPTLREMELYVRAGMTPEQVIVAATKAGAEALRLERDLGTLETGKTANLLVLDADPRIDITNMKRIARVFIRGQELERAALRARLNPR